MTRSPAAREARGDRREIVVTALAALDSADVEYALRNGDITVDDASADVDVLVRSDSLDDVHRALTGVGWSWLRAPGHRGHRFYLREADDLTWVKLDVVTRLRYGHETVPIEPVLDARRRVGEVWVVSDDDARRHTEHRLAGRREIATPAERLARKLPVSLRRRGCVVAVLGPDGAGKGTVTAGLAASLPVAVTQVYLGGRRGGSGGESSPAPSGDGSAPPRWHPSTAGGVVQGGWELLFLARRLAEWTPPLLKAGVAAWRGHVVLTDRHPLDAVAVRPRRLPLTEKLERFLATRMIPTPDAVVVLDAPGQVLFDRKGEHTPERLERWRQGYRDHLVPRGALLVDASGPVERTTAEARHMLWVALARRRSWPTR
jgi:thymidylate kinase